MAFPQDPLPIRAELQIDGKWVEHTDRVRDSSPNSITITGGFAPEQATIQPSTISFALNNRDGLFTDDNPTSDYFEKLPINTPFRVSVEETLPFLYLPLSIDRDPNTDTTGWQAGYIGTSDKASLDITGDLDLRIDVEPDTWQLGSAGHTLAAKWENGTSNRSWFWTVLPSGCIRLYWSTDGTFNLSAGLYADSTVPVPGTGRIALRTTIDVNNGASGRTVTFYTSDSVTGTWTQLGDAVVQSGTTSIFSGTSSLHVGAMRNFALTYPFTSGAVTISLPLVGRIHRFQLRSGIGGTLVADMNATAQAEGTTSWSDGLASPNTWDIINSGEITKADYRATGEISQMPQEWDDTGADVYVPTVASDIIRRLTQGATPLRSAIFRNLRSYIGTDALGYWPLEGDSQTVAASNAVPNQPAGVAVNVLFSADTDFPASAGVMTLNDTNSSITFKVIGTRSADHAFVIFYYKYPATPGADTETFHLYTSGTCRRVTFTVGTATYRVTAYDIDGVSLGTSFTSFGTGAEPGQYLALQMKLSKNGSGVDIDLGWYPLGTTTAFYGITPLNVASATVGAVIGGATAAGAAAAGVSFAHVMMGNTDFEFATSAFASSSIGFAGETALARWLRVLREEGEQGRFIGWPDDTDPMGPQPADTLVKILDECVTTASALHYGARDQLSLVFRTQRSMLAQAAVELDYTLKHLSGNFRPTNDDRLLKNQVTAQARYGGFAVAVKETGRKSIQPPPDGVGLYDATVSVNPYSDDQLPDVASYAVHQGTWPERRVPNLEVWLERPEFTSDTTLTRRMRSVNPGDRVSVDNVPVWVGGGTTDTLVRGYQETLMFKGQRLAFSTIPYGPFLAVNDLTDRTGARNRAGASNTVLAANATSGAMSLVALTPLGAKWTTTAGDFSLDILLGGERVTVSGIAAWIADTFTRSTSSGWGSTSTGSSAWTTTGGSASDYSTTGTAGRINLSTVTTNRTAALDLNARVSEVVFDRVQMLAALTGAGATCTFTIRVGSSTDRVDLNIQATVAGTATCWLSQVVNSVETVFDSGFPSTGLSATAAMSVRFQIVSDGDGDPIARARIWAQGAAEPGAWTTSIAMTQANAIGDLTLIASRNSSSTNASPFNVEFDGLTLPSLQLMTVSARSVNDVVKAQTADTSIQVADDFYAARN